ncbi:MAG: hypothetical protein WC807_00720 [Hyphomicrobium sp.]
MVATKDVTMIGYLVDHAKLRAEAIVTHYGGRAAVSVPIAIAGGFAVAAIFLLIQDQVGAIWACAIMSAAFLVLALVVAMAVLARERHQREMLRQSARHSALMTGLFTAAPLALSGGRSVARGVRDRVGLGVPLLLGSVVLAALLASSRSPERKEKPH